MWICISKKAARAGAQIVRQVSNFADDLGESLIEAKKVFLNDQDNKKNVKSLKIAILGLPNAGKSTLINHLIGRPVSTTFSPIYSTTFSFEDELFNIFFFNSGRYAPPLQRYTLHAIRLLQYIAWMTPNWFSLIHLEWWEEVI